jgi:hypothetical protein
VAPFALLQPTQQSPFVSIIKVDIGAGRQSSAGQRALRGLKQSKGEREHSELTRGSHEE